MPNWGYDLGEGCFGTEVVPTRLPALLAAMRDGDLGAASNAAALALVDCPSGLPVRDPTGRRLFVEVVEALLRQALRADHQAVPELAGTLLRTLDGAPAESSQSESRAFALFVLGFSCGKHGHAALSVGQAADACAMLERAVTLLAECLRIAEDRATVLPVAQSANADFARALLARGLRQQAVQALEESVSLGMAAPPSNSASRVLAAAFAKLGTLAGETGYNVQAVHMLSAALAALLEPLNPTRLRLLREGRGRLEQDAVRGGMQGIPAEVREMAVDMCLDLATAEAATGSVDRALDWADLAVNLSGDVIGDSSTRLRERGQLVRFGILGRLDRVADVAGSLEDARPADGTLFSRLGRLIAVAHQGEEISDQDLADFERLLTEPFVDGVPELEIHRDAMWIQLIGLPRGDAVETEARLRRMNDVLSALPHVDQKLFAIAAYAEAVFAEASADAPRAYAALGRAHAALRRTDDPEFTPTVWRLTSAVADGEGRRDAAVLFAKLGVRALQLRRDRLQGMDRGMDDLQYNEVAYGLLEQLLVGAYRYAEATELTFLKAMGDLTDDHRPDHVPYRPNAGPSLTQAEREAAEVFTALDGAPTTIGRWLAEAMPASPDWVPPRRIQRAWPIMPGEPTAILTYAFDASSVTIRVTFGGSTRSVHVPCSGDDLARHLFELLQALRRATGTPARQLAEEAYRLLLAPVRLWLDEAFIRHLAIEATGPLAALPLACLHDGNDWLVRRFAVTRLPAFPVARLTRTPNRAIHLALFGNRDGAATTDLRAVLTELKEIEAAAARAGMACEPRPSGDADLSCVAAAVAGGATVLHLAMHAEADPADPNRSRLLTGRSWVPGAALRDLNLSGVDLAVLSACETATPSGKPGPGGAVGLDTLLQEAGAASTLGSLWRVGDLSTARLMGAFYRTLLGSGGHNKASALRVAQLELLDDPALSAPYHWGAFVLGGNWLGLT